MSTPGSPNFRQFLTPAQFTARFGASDATLAAVRQSLRDRGLRVTGVSANRLIVHVTGATQRIERAFGVSLLRYRLPDGRVAYANTTAPRLPRDVATGVAEIVGLDSLAPLRSHIVRAPEAGPQPTATCAQQIATASRNYPRSLVSSTDLAQAYGFGDLYQSGNLGQGATVALIEFSSFLPADIGAFASCYGITPHVNEVAVDGGPGAPVTFGAGVGDQVEAELDIEAVLGLAPNATIDVFEAPQSADSSSLDVFSAAIDDPDVQVISTSWGRCEGNSGTSLTDAEATLFQQAAAEGKTIVAAAGDNGSEDCYGQTFGFQKTALAVDDPASQPFVTGVGGTTFATLGPPPARRPSGTPRPRPAAAASRPCTRCRATSPAHRRRSASSTSSPACTNIAGNCREVPDVAANAGTPFATYCTESGRDGCDPGGWTGFGGTSLAAPIWGAFFALANASPACSSKRIGFANPALYAIAGGAGYASAFGDVTAGQQRPRLPERPLPGRAGLRPRHRARDADRGRRHRHAARASSTSSARPPAPVPVTTVTGISPDAGPLRGGTKCHDPRLGPRARERRPLRREEGRVVHRPVRPARSSPSLRAEPGTVGVDGDDEPRHEPRGRRSPVRYLAAPDGREAEPVDRPGPRRHEGHRDRHELRRGERGPVRRRGRPGRSASSRRPGSPPSPPRAAPAAAVTVTTPGGTSRKAPGGLFRYA